MTDDLRPRILFEEVPPDILEDLVKFAGTAQVITSDDPIHASDWDLLVTFNWDASRRPSRLHVLSFGAVHSDLVSVGPGVRTSLIRHHVTLARSAVPATGLSSELRRLVERTVIPNVEREGAKETWQYDGRGLAGSDMALVWTGDLAGRCQPLVHVGVELAVYALCRQRAGGKAGWSWALPPETTGHREWLQYVLTELRALDPENFPSDPTWTDSKEWATPPLRDALERLAAVESERVQLLADLDSREEAIRKQLDTEQEQARQGAWRLLTEKGDPLAEAVQACLTELGFTVQDMDGHHDAETKAKLEDLRVTVEGDPDWVALVEVKGYARGGAKASDVPQITGRPSVNYVLEAQRVPSTVWHIVNAYPSMDPGARPKAIANDAVDLAPLTQANGALIDTRDLYRAWRDVTAGDVSPEEVRTSLQAARTRWRWERPGS